ncbi:MAG: glucokinase, partial [Alphaproteobacteria bacterium]
MAIATPPLRLIADIGGTNARFALASADGEIGPTVVMPVAAHAAFADALAAYVVATGARFHAAALAAAGPRDGDAIRLTNAGWTIDPAGVRRVAPNAAVAIFNDLEAVAFALPHLRADDV